MISDETDDRRHSAAVETKPDSDPAAIAEREALNALRQYDAIVEMVQDALTPGRTFKLRPSAILYLHRCALEGLTALAGVFRPGDVKIGQSKHAPPGAHLVPGLIEEMCDYVNENWSRSPLHLAAYLLWRLNWIHPFADGNGRTSRAISYYVMSVRLGYVLPGEQTIPEQIAKNRKPYYAALEAADEELRLGKVDVSELEGLLSGLLAKQLYGVIEKATGTTSA